ncbi:MICOS complex subunit mic60 [Cryomyces antarcticus]|nr:MICOS complex subunit mic60 [Cryomyces antarcticus]
MPGDASGRMEVRNWQTSVVRTNCMDCLDRTNVVQSMLGRWTLTRMLTDLGLLRQGETAQDDAAFEHLFRNVWADNADVVSKSYSGTGALKTDFTRTGNRTRAGAMQDLNSSVTRYMKNNFADGPRQDAFDLFLGTYLPSTSSIGSTLQFVDRRPLLVQSIPYILTASMFFIFISLFTRRLPDATIWPLRILIMLCLVATAWSGRFVWAHGTLYRYFADTKRPDQTVLPGTQSTTTVRDIPDAPTLSPAAPSSGTIIPPENIPKTPPTPQQVQATPPPPPPPSPPTSVPLGTGSSSVAPPPGPPRLPPPAPKRKPRRFRRFLLTLLMLSGLGYAGGVYYSFVSDNFHDFFTEYIPFGEDAVGYFEEREFRKRFPARELPSRAYPQVRGENKVTISSKSGLTPRVAGSENKGSDLASKGRHVSALDDNPPTEVAGKQAPSNPSPPPPAEKSEPVPPAKTDAKPATKPAAQPAADAKAAADREGGIKLAAPKETKQESKAEPMKPAQTASIDPLNVKSADEPVVQDVVNIINDIITVVNADNAAGKYASAMTKAKESLGKVISDIQTLKAQEQKAADDKMKATHAEFDSAAKELVKRLENEMHEQETRWKDEYESEREKLSQTYQQKLQSELDAAKKVFEQRLKNEMLEREIELKQQFTKSVSDRVETERSGRLSKLNELSSSVTELEKLTGEWNAVVDATLRTQHLNVAIDAVRASLEAADRPTPFTTELAALKEVAADDAVVNAAIASINPAAYQRGIPTPSMLIDRFRRVAAEVRKAALLPDDAGVASHAASLLLSRFMFKKQGRAVGEDVEAVLTRTEMLLEEGDLENAAREMNALQGWAKVLSKDWIEEARRVSEVRQALDVITTEARLRSLLVD